MSRPVSLPSAPRPPSRASARGRWLAFTLSGALAVGTVYWIRSTRQPALPAQFDLPSIDLATLPTDLGQRLVALQQQIEAGNNLLENLTRLGRVAHASGLPEIARTCWAQLAEFEPGNAHWPYFLADLARSQRNDAGERTRLEESLKLDPTYATTYLHLGNLHFRNGELDEAAKAYRHRLTLLPDDPHARLGLARIAQREGRKNEGVDLLRETVQVAPDFPSAHNLLAAELAAQGEVEGARQHRWLGHSAGRWKQAPDPWLEDLEEDCYDPDQLYVLTTRDFQLNRPDQALKWINRISVLRPNDYASLEFLGDIHLKLGEPMQAIEEMNQALKLAKDDEVSVPLFSNLAAAYRQIGKPELALQATNRGLTHHPDAVELHNSRGVCLSELGHQTEAIAAFRDAIALQPYDADANFNLGYTLLEQGEEAAGIDSIRRSLTQQPTFGKALTFLGQYELNSGSMAEAKVLLERLYDAFWGIPDARRLWAEWHFKAGAIISVEDEKQAEAFYRKGLKIDPDLSDLHLGLGALLVSENRIPEAMTALRRVQELSPDDPRGFLYMGQALIATGQTGEARQQLQIGLDLATLSGQTATGNRCRELLRGL